MGCSVCVYMSSLEMHLKPELKICPQRGERLVKVMLYVCNTHRDLGNTHRERVHRCYICRQGLAMAFAYARVCIIGVRC